MLRTFSKFAASLASVLIAPSFAFAHAGGDQSADLVHGFSHPFSGIDHILAMTMVGIFAAQCGGRAILLVPSVFVAVMAFGGAVGAFGNPLPFVETSIALTVVVLGILVAFNVKVRIAVAVGVVGIFAIFHGYSHGVEMPDHASGYSYAAGFMLATAMLNAIGIALRLGLGSVSNLTGRLVTQSTGGVTAIAGVGLLSGLM